MQLKGPGRLFLCQPEMESSWPTRLRGLSCLGLLNERRIRRDLIQLSNNAFSEVSCVDPLETFWGIRGHRRRLSSQQSTMNRVVNILL